jgi:hypothetical protein
VCVCVYIYSTRIYALERGNEESDKRVET